jgi:hypothetical protein
LANQSTNKPTLRWQTRKLTAKKNPEVMPSIVNLLNLSPEDSYCYSPIKGLRRVRWTAGHSRMWGPPPHSERHINILFNKYFNKKSDFLSFIKIHFKLHNRNDLQWFTIYILFTFDIIWKWCMQ